MKVTYNQLTELTGRTYRTIKKRIDGLEPVGTTRNNANQWESKEALPLIYGICDDDDKINTAEEKARLDKARRIGQELKNKQLQGDLIDADDVSEMLARIVVAAKTKVLGIKSKIAPILNELVPDPEIRDNILSLIDSQSREALSELSQGADE